MKNSFLLGLMSVALATILWGLQFPIASDVFRLVDPFFVTSIRYSVASCLLFPMVYFFGKDDLLGYGLNFRRGVWLGIVGMSLSPVLVFWGISLSTAEQSALIVAMQPTIAVLIYWFLLGTRPAPFVLGCVGLAFIGVLLVITKGQLNFSERPQVLLGNLMTFAGAACWVVYSIEAPKLQNWDLWKVTLLTMVPGTIFTIILTLVLVSLGVVQSPVVEEVFEIGWELFYLSVVGVLFGMLAWNFGNQRIGALNSTLFVNLIPVAAFGMRALQGQEYHSIELFGMIK